MTAILKITASANPGASVTTTLSSLFLETIENEKKDISITERDISRGLPFLTPEWVGANFTPEEERSQEQAKTLQLSDTLIEELEKSNLILLSLPIYNFSIPASVKAWIDLIARARKTFRYTADGPIGLLEGKTLVLFVASGGTAVESPLDFAVPYMKHVLKFIGITDVHVVAADAMATEPDTLEIAKAKAKALARELGNGIDGPLREAS
ncbi:NAD(P)H-dependent oxidoreductase [Temperatibacter marinus]|uniref:FMN dependent NADH:quinone oxidoreductase n=1 Tax=Temperatibacter marinus TaxID=1456591 RepID=A0AA52EGD4_9PROT|nr:NAD(P)H-dependent oxidoreductase [Temperatibacter marinus]WND02029.1 NAD(P)H-dependent oxidoreductase [Temperatibacter marinus]